MIGYVGLPGTRQPSGSVNIREMLASNPMSLSVCIFQRRPPIAHGGGLGFLGTCQTADEMRHGVGVMAGRAASH